MIENHIAYLSKGLSCAVFIHPEDNCQRSKCWLFFTIKDIEKHEQIKNRQLLGKYIFAGVWIGHCSKFWHHNPVCLNIGIVGVTSQVFAPVMDFTWKRSSRIIPGQHLYKALTSITVMPGVLPEENDITCRCNDEQDRQELFPRGDTSLHMGMNPCSIIY